MNDNESIAYKKLADKIIYFGEVVSIDDPYESRQIRVRIPDFDIRVENEDLPPCFPLLPAFFHFVPKVGERVVVFMDRVYNGEKTMNQEKRYYLSVTISQPQRINNDPYYYTAASNESDGYTERETPISEIPQAKGTYAEKEHIGIIGRDNTDLLFKEGEVLIRAGKHQKEDVTEFNRKDPAFIQIRYGVDNSSNVNKTKTITKIENIEPEHAINVSTDAQNRLMVKVFRLSDNFVEETFSAGYESRESLITATKAKIKEYQEKYPRWQLRTSEPELAKEPILFPNNKRIVKEKVQVREENQFDQFAGSVMNIVAEKINLLSHKSEKNYNLTNPEKQIDEDTQLEINSTAHPLVFGDKLVEFIELVKLWVANHVHPYHGLPVAKDEITNKILNFNLDELLDMNIRIG